MPACRPQYRYSSAGLRSQARNIPCDAQRRLLDSVDIRVNVHVQSLYVSVCNQCDGGGLRLPRSLSMHNLHCRSHFVSGTTDLKANLIFSTVSLVADANLSRLYCSARVLRAKCCIHSSKTQDCDCSVNGRKPLRTARRPRKQYLVRCVLVLHNSSTPYHRAVR